MKPEPPRVGSFVIYCDPKKGPLTAHVLEVLGEGQLKLRAHQTARPDFDVTASFSTKLKKGHWSYR